MAKKNVGTNFILSIVGLITAVLSFIALALNFVAVKAVGLFGGTDTTQVNLKDWSKAIDNMQKINDGLGDRNLYDLAGWQMGRVFLVITLVLVAVLAVALVVKFFINHKILNLATFIVGIVTVVSALVFAIAMFAGCGALSGSGVTYMANVGVYILTLAAIATGALSAVVARKK